MSTRFWFAMALLGFPLPAVTVAWPAPPVSWRTCIARLAARPLRSPADTTGGRPKIDRGKVATRA
jgi:hypothetical protein